jgi:hypothetical protein
MGDRMTSINLPGEFGSGLAEYGRQTVPQMIRAIRDHARLQKAQAEKLLAAADADFCVETYKGVCVRRNIEVLQDGRKFGATRAATKES